jgi:sporulation protein YlmC with PRC-barrel domain
MKTGYCERTAIHILAVGSLVVTLGMAVVAPPADARDKSGVLKASELIGMKVESTEGKSLGDIKDLVIDPDDGSIQYAVLDFGGFAGIGDKYFAVPWEALQLGQGHDKIALDVSKRDLKNAPGFDKNNWPDLSEQQEVAIYEFYGIPDRDQEAALQPLP